MTGAAKSRIAGLNRRTVKLVLVTGLPIYALLILFAPRLFHLWLGGQYAQNLPDVFRVMAVGGFASLIAVPAFYILMGSGRVVACFWGFGIPAFFNVVCITALVGIFGNLKVEYVAYSFVLGTSLSSLYLMWKSRQAYHIMPCLASVDACSIEDAGLSQPRVGGAGSYLRGT